VVALGRGSLNNALITLSAAVGLPSGGFNLGPADVDADGQVTSRDALAMLSNSIGLPTYGFRVGNGIVDRCAAQLILPRPLFFVRGGPNPGLAIRATDSTVTIPGDLVDISESYPWRPRVSPDGSQVLFVCLTGSFYQNICKANADGSGVVNLTNDYVRDASPDWSPDGTQIVFVRNNQIWMMDTSGATPVQAISSPASGVTSVAWQPISGSHHVAYTLNVCCTYSGEVHTTILDTTGSDIPVRQMVCCAVQQPRYVDWNATGDSLIFDVYVDGYLSIAAAPAAAGAGLDVRIAMNGVAEQPAWTDQGILFVTATTASYRLFLQRPDGSLAQVRPDNVDNFLPGMKRQ